MKAPSGDRDAAYLQWLGHVVESLARGAEPIRSLSLLCDHSELEMSTFRLSASYALAVHDNGDQSGAKGVSIVDVGVDVGGDRLSVTGQRIGQELKETQELGKLSILGQLASGLPHDEVPIESTKPVAPELSVGVSTIQGGWLSYFPPLRRFTV